MRNLLELATFPVLCILKCPLGKHFFNSEHLNLFYQTKSLFLKCYTRAAISVFHYQQTHRTGSDQNVFFPAEQYQSAESRFCYEVRSFGIHNGYLVSALKIENKPEILFAILKLLFRVLLWQAVWFDFG